MVRQRVRRTPARAWFGALSAVSGAITPETADKQRKVPDGDQIDMPPSPRPARACGWGGSGGWPTSWRRAARARWGALIALQTLYVEPTTVFSIQYSVDMLFMVLIGGMGTIEGPVLGALVLFGLQEALSSYGAWYLVIVGGLAVAATLVSSRGLWGFAAERFGWSLLPVGYRVRPPRG